MPTSAGNQKLSPDQKREVGKRLIRGEDVNITLTSEPEVTTDENEPTKTRITELGQVTSNGDTGGDSPNGHSHTHAPQQQQEAAVPSELVVQVLSNRAGIRETELAIREARILMLEAEVRELLQIIEEIQGN